MNDTPAPSTPPPTAPPARAFAQGTGVVLQIVGVVMFLLSGCVCATSGLWDPVPSRGQVYEQLDQGQTFNSQVTDLIDRPAAAGAMITVMFATVGGLALAGFGLGLQSDQPRAAWGAMITAGVLLGALVLAGAGLWIGHASWAARLWHGGLTLCVTVVVIFVALALQQVRADPPPPGPEPYIPSQDENTL